MNSLSKSWKELKPLKIIEDLKEPFEDYYKRIQENKRLKHIPRMVLQHWIFDQHDNGVTIENYAWLNFYEIEFVKIKWQTEKFQGVNVLKPYRRYVGEKSASKSVDEFYYSDYWRKKGTWEVSPVILDVGSFKNEIPQHSKIKGSYQYVDGHTRLGCLYALINISKTEKTNLANNHCIYLMK